MRDRPQGAAPRKRGSRRSKWFGALCLLSSIGIIISCKGTEADFVDPPKGTGNDGTLTSTIGETTSGKTDESTPTSTSSSTTTGDPTDNTATNTSDESSTDSSTTPQTCDDIVCSGHGGCDMVGGVPQCVCDEGYVIDEAGTECIVDESCIKLRFLEDHCRQYVQGPPAVVLFFGIDFCAGTAVTPEKLAKLKSEQEIDFAILENDKNILDNAESFAQLIPTRVESYLTIVLDVSKSVIGDEEDGTPPSVDLSALVGEMRNLVSSLKPTAGEAPVAVSIIVFARGVAEYVAFTDDFALIDEKLAAIEVDHSFLPDSVAINGSDLYSAVLDGLHSTQRIRDLRAAISLDGMLTTGTVVVITDGNDQSGAAISKVSGELNSTLNQVISIGISEDIEDEVLTTLGPDGSFLAPTPTDWSLAFDEIAQRVEEYPDRAYLLGYCSAKTTGNQNVTVSMETPRPDVALKVTGASCRYSADDFSTDPAEAAKCKPSLFDAECDGRSCGGLTACGACGNSQCCAGGSCVAPSTKSNCDEQNELCHPTGQICIAEDPVASTKRLTCGDMLLAGDVCYSDCEPGVTYCQKPEDKDADKDPGICVAVKALGSLCEFGDECETLNCTQKNPDSDTDPKRCLPPAELHDHCGSGTDADCEFGGYCLGSACEPRKRGGVTCSKGSECRSGTCDTDERVCWGVSQCYWPWNEKLHTSNP